MINQKQVFYDDITEPCREYDSRFDTRISRLQSTLFGRLNLVNILKRIIDINHIPLTLKNIDVDIEKEQEIESFLLKSNNWIESKLSKEFEQWIEKNGTDWQKSRV